MTSDSKQMWKNPYQLWQYADMLDKKELKKVVKASIAAPLKWHCPNGAQEEYIKTIADSTRWTRIPVILSTFANGVGKSTESVSTLLNIIYKPQNGWYDFPIFHNFPFPRKIWYCSTAEAIKDTIMPMIKKYALPGTFTYTKEGKSHVSKVIFETENNGKWELSFKTFDQETKAFESDTVGIIIADEPMPEDLWKAVKSRRRLGCILMLPMTPLYCPPYVMDEVQNNSQSDRSGYMHLMADIYEACRVRGKRGHLEPDIIDDMVKNYDADEKDARAFGKFMYFAGTIYSTMKRETHFVNPEEYPIPEGSTIINGIDPHDGRPSAIGWCALTPANEKGERRYIFFDELPNFEGRAFWDLDKPMTVRNEANMIKFKEKQHPFSTDSRVMDKHFGWQTRGGNTIALQFSAQKLVYASSYSAPKGDPEVQFGHNQVLEALKPLSDGKPGLVIWNTCEHTWRGMSHYIRKRRTGKTAEDYASADGKIVEKFKDYPDMVRYIICHHTKTKEMAKPGGRYSKQWAKVLGLDKKKGGYKDS